MENQVGDGGGQVITESKVLSPTVLPVVSKPVDGKFLSLGRLLDIVSILSHLAFFGIIGVLIRYSFELLLGPEVGRVTDDQQALFIDLPANMVGSFIMGWVGVVAKKTIASFSEQLAVGLSTGLCGSITTFASWNQRMLAILSKGLWFRALSGYVIGAELAYISLLIGIDSCTAFLTFIENLQCRREESGKLRFQLVTADHVDRRWFSLVLFFTTSALFWVGGAIGAAVDVHCLARRRLWLATVLAPFGVWLRWFLSRFNGWGFGKNNDVLQWIPWGTFVTNVAAAAIEAILSTVVLAVQDDTNIFVNGALQLGFLGCMSTVSTLVVEVRTLRSSSSAPWRSYAYMLISLVASSTIGILLYSIPVWVNHYDSKYNAIGLC